MASRLSASALKGLQANRNEARLAQGEQQRIKDKGIARIAKAEQARRNKLEKQWQQQMLNIIRAAASGEFHLDVKAVIWSYRLIDAGLLCYHRDIRKLESAIESFEATGEEICKQIAKAQSKVISLLRKPLLVQFGTIVKVREIFERAAELVSLEDCDSFTKALSVVNSKFRLIDRSPAAEQLDQLDQLHQAWLNNYFEKLELEERLDFENDGGVFNGDAPDSSFPSLILIKLSVEEENIVANSGATIRINWKDVGQTMSKDCIIDPEFSVQSLAWISREGQGFFSFLDDALGDLPLGVDSYDFIVERNIHDQYLVKAGINNYIESPSPAQIERCMQALGYECEISIGDDDQHLFCLRW